MTSYIFNPFSPLPQNKKSHVRGWAMHWQHLLSTPQNEVNIHQKHQSFGEAETLYLDHGVNFGGVLNLFGGVTPELVDRLIELAESNAQVVSLDIPMPDYVGMLRKRQGNATCDQRLTKALLDKLQTKFNKVDTITQYHVKHNGVTIGDSHTTSMAGKHTVADRTNGKTLYGSLKNGGLKSLVKNNEDNITFSLGSIDIRHHAMRHSKKEFYDMVSEYVKQLKELTHDGLKVAACAPVPVEFEGRKIPKTGYYQGTPFYGTRDDRLDLTLGFMETILNSGIELVSPPMDWYTMDGEEFASTYMELNSSVHLAPQHYRRFDWGINHVFDY